MDMFHTYYMLAAVQGLKPERTFFKNRYFPTNTALDVFGTSKVLIDYKEGTQRLAPFVVPRIGGVSVMRDGFETMEIEPPNISLTMPLTLDHLQNRMFGEALFSDLTPEDRARLFLLQDMENLSMRISRREEWMAAQTILNNGCLMEHITDREGKVVPMEVRYYKDSNNPTIYTTSAPWTNDDAWMQDVAAMARELTKRGLPATDLVVSADVGDFILQSEKVQKLLDNRRMEMGRIAPKELPDGVTHLGALNFSGRMLDIIVVDETYETEDGQDTPFLADGSVIVTAPNCGHTLYGAVSQLEADGEFHTYAGARVPLHLFQMKPPVKETQLTSKPIMAPYNKNPWMVATDVFN